MVRLRVWTWQAPPTCPPQDEYVEFGTSEQNWSTWIERSRQKKSVSFL